MAQCALAGVACLPLDFCYFFLKNPYYCLIFIQIGKKLKYSCRCDISYHHVPYLQLFQLIKVFPEPSGIVEYERENLAGSDD